MVDDEKKITGTSKDRRRELDDFWDISSLVVAPQKRSSPRTAFDTATTEIELSSVSKNVKTKNDGASPAQIQQHDVCADAAYSISEQKIKKDACSEQAKAVWNNGAAASSVLSVKTYCPEHPLIEEVTLHPWRTQFPYYERFCQNARDLFAVKGEKCSQVSFFSYMPQYDQMNRAQLAWYLYWRDCVRKGEYLKTDYSYIFLLLFEIINLPDQIPPEKGLSMLCQLWSHYREEHPLLDRYLCEWICDYCLLYQLLPPIQEMGVSFRDIAAECQLREFYVAPGKNGGGDDMTVYLRCCSNYDYRKSRAYTSSETVAAAFDQHIPGALRAVLAALTPNNTLFSQTKMQTTTLMRDTFVGALCSHRVKYKIEVRYRSFSRSHELRFFITDVIKYSENKLRAALGYKSRLSIYALPEQAKAVLNAYFADAFPKAGGREGAVIVRPEYEKLYDLPDIPMSAAQAEKIEQASWATTQRLVEAFEDMRDDDAISKSQTKEPCAPQGPDFSSLQPASLLPDKENASPFTDEQRAFLRLVLHGDKAEQKQFCKQLDKMPEMLADAINEIAANTLGDILLEDDGDGTFDIIDDYLDEVPTLIGE